MLVRCLATLSIALWSCAGSVECTHTHAQIIAAAERAARADGQDVDHKFVQYSPTNWYWQRYSRDTPGLLSGLEPELRSALETVPYLVVYFAPDDHDMVGGDVSVFLARSDLHVLGFLRGM